MWPQLKDCSTTNGLRDKTLVPYMDKGKSEKVLFADNFSFQLEKDFHERCRKDLNTIVYPLLPNNTDKVQAIDAGFGMSMKQFIGDNLNKWLEIDDSVDVWHDKMTAKVRKILMTKWTGEAWDELKKRAEYTRGCLRRPDVS